MTITREICVTHKTLPNPIEYVQGTNALPIVFTFADYTIPEGTAAKVYAEKPSGYCQYDIAAIADNTVVVDVKDTMFDEVGTSNIQIKLTTDDKTLITFDYPVRVSKNRVAGNIPQSGNNSDLIDELLARGEPAVEAAEAAADRANAASDRLEGTDVGTLTRELDAHTASQASAATGIHGIRIYEGKLQYNTAEEGRPANWIDVFAKPQFPVGYIIMTASSTNPGTYLGGTWERWGEGRTIVGVDTSDTDFSTAEKTGGEKTHKLTQDEMPAHSHSLTGALDNPNAPEAANLRGTGYSTTVQQLAQGKATSTGGDQAHNNMPPYITCFIWKRTA